MLASASQVCAPHEQRIRKQTALRATAPRRRRLPRATGLPPSQLPQPPVSRSSQVKPGQPSPVKPGQWAARLRRRTRLDGGFDGTSHLHALALARTL